jgi:hypothetical protein
MKNAFAARAGIAALVYAACAGVAQAASESGTEAMAEMNVSGAQLGMFVGGLAVMGLVIWGIVKVVNK